MSIQGYVHQIVDPGEDFEIYCGPDATIQWVDAPDDITIDWTLEWSPSAGQMIWVEREIIVDDPDDDQLPLRKSELIRFKEGDDVSMEDPKIQAIFNAVFGQ